MKTSDQLQFDHLRRLSTDSVTTYLDRRLLVVQERGRSVVEVDFDGRLGHD